MMRKVLGWVIGAGAVCFALVLAGYGFSLLGFGGNEGGSEGSPNVVVIASRTPEIVVSDTPIPLPTDTLEVLVTASSQRIDELFLQVEGVTAVELASERDMGQQIGAVAMLTIDANAPLEETRDALWDAWEAHAREVYPAERRLVLDLTINQGGVESQWQYTSNSTRWLQLR